MAAQLPSPVLLWFSHHLSLFSPLVSDFSLEKVTCLHIVELQPDSCHLAQCEEPCVLVVLIIAHLRASLAERREDVWGLTHTVNLAFLPCARKDLCAPSENMNTNCTSTLALPLYLLLITVRITNSTCSSAGPPERVLRNWLFGDKNEADINSASTSERLKS